MKKLFVTLTALCAMSMGAWAADDDYTGSAGSASELVWTLPYEGGTMTITGDYMPMLDSYENLDAIWNSDEVRPKITAINMQNGQTVGAHAFKNCANLESFSYYCAPEYSGLLKIGDYAFNQSSKLASVTFSNSHAMRYIGAYAFAGTALKTFTVNKPTTTPAEEILNSLSINQDYCSVGEYAFKGCRYLSTVYMKDATPFAETYNNFLYDFTYLVVDNAEVAATYKNVWSSIADRIIYLAQPVVFDNDSTFKDICVKNWDTNKDGELSYEEAFAVTDFGTAFAGNTDLKEITLNDLKPFVNVTTIGSGAFAGCTNLEKITIPPFVTDIADDAFTGCTSLKEVHFVTEIPFKDEFTVQLNERTHIIVPDAYLPAYDATWTNKSELIIGESHIPFQCPETKSICVANWDTNKDGELSYAEAAAVTSINYKFQYNKSITSFDEFMYFTGVTSINVREFMDCTRLASFVIPANVTSVGERAFWNTKSLSKLIIMDGAKSIQFSFGGYESNVYRPMFYYSPLDTVYIGRSITFNSFPNNDKYATPFAYNSTLRAVTIGGKVTYIAEGLFAGCSFPTITIPVSVTSIGGAAFMGCKNLASITIPETAKLASIESKAFANCSSLASVFIPVSVTSIGYAAFLNCSSLASITIPETAKLASIKQSAFENCSSLASITISETAKLASIEMKAFANCSSLASVFIPESVTSIGYGAFLNCSSLASITIPETAKLASIGQSAFNGCRNLSSLTIPSSVTSIESSAFNSIPTVILNSATPSPSAYNSFSDIATYIVPDESVSAYRTAWADVAYRIAGKNAFDNGIEVTCEAQPTSSSLLEKIGAENISDVVKLRISGTINSYDMMVMRTKLTNLRSLDLTNATIVANSYSVDVRASEDNVFSNFMGDKYLTSIWLPESITKIGEYALSGCRYIKTVSIPNNVVSIGNYAFNWCLNLSSVTVSEGSKLQSIGSYGFQSTSCLKSIDFTNATQMTIIGAHAFRSSGIKTIGLPASLTFIGDNAFNGSALTEYASHVPISPNVFQGCTSLKTATIRTGAGTIGDYAFDGCTALDTVTIEDGLTAINQYAFNGCSALKYVTLPNSLKTIGKYAFQNNSALQNIDLPSSLTTVGTYAFTGCTALKSIVLPSSLTSIGTYAFNGCTALKSVEFELGAKNLSQYMFNGCTALTDVKLSSKTTSIPSYAFQNCTALTKFHLPPYLTSIGSNAFSGCRNIKEVYAYMPDVPAIAASTFSNYTTSTLYAPAFLWDAYTYDGGWNKFLYVLKCDLRPGDYEAFYTNKDLYFKEGEERITQDRPIVELGNQGAIIVEGVKQEFTTVDMERGATSSSLIGDNNIPMDSLRVKMDVEKHRWYFLCFPYDVEIEKCTYPGKYAWRYYDGAERAANGSGGWKKVEGTTLKANQGYIFQSDTKGKVWVKFAKPSIGGDRPKELETHESGTANNASWNFVGNPYTSYYDLQVEDFTAPITVWNGSSYVAYRPGDDDYHLQPFEAFFVQKPEGADKIAFDADRQETYRESVATTAAQARTRMAKGINPERKLINITVSDNDTAMTDRTRLVLNEKASRDYEMECDAAKFLSDDAKVQIYTVEGTTLLAINERPEAGDVRLGYVAKKAGTYTLAAQRMDMPMVIVDNETGTTFDLSNGAYTFSTKKGTFNKRFMLRPAGNATAISKITDETGVAIGTQDGGLNIGGAEGKSVSIYTVGGVLVAEQSGNGFVSLASGTYVVSVNGVSAKINVK